MNDSTVEISVSRFDDCQTKAEVEDLLKELTAPHYAITSQFKRARSKRVKELRIAELQPFHELACRFKRGQKVYFAKSLKSVAMDWNFKTIKGSEKDIEAGDWCRVYEYQAKARRLWLCKPGTKCDRKNVIRDPFSVRDIMDHGISRTELAIR